MADTDSYTSATGVPLVLVSAAYNFCLSIISGESDTTVVFKAHMGIISINGAATISCDTITKEVNIID